MTAYALTEDQLRRGRWKVACINWSAPPSIAHAVSYLLIDGEAHMERFHPDHATAIAHADQFARGIARWLS